MDKNENGYPGCVGCVTANDSSGGCGSRCVNNGDTTNPGNMPTNHSCGGDGSCLDNMPLAYVYAPNQVFRMLYSANDAMKHGTLFEELYKPMEVYGRE